MRATFLGRILDIKKSAFLKLLTTLRYGFRYLVTVIANQDDLKRLVEKDAS